MSMQTQEIPFIKEMFDKIAHKYDFLNRLLSLRQDIIWRKTLSSEINVPKHGKVLDAACGTADLSIEIANTAVNTISVFGVDFSSKMLEIADRKIKKISCNSKIYLICANAFNLPFSTETFDAVTIAFGIRNINNKAGALKIFYECLKPGGKIFILELTTPKKGILLSAYLLYFKKILPFIGMFFSKNKIAYNYLPESVMNFPENTLFSQIMRRAGFENISCKKMTLGIATIFTGSRLKK